MQLARVSGGERCMELARATLCEERRRAVLYAGVCGGR